MTTYYVRKGFSDSNAGTSAGAAWLTIDKAANTVAAGDTVYIGAGVYRELVTMDTSGSSGSAIKFIADTDGKMTGDAGKVIVTAHDDEISAAARASCWDMNGKEFIEVSGITFVGNTGNFVVGNSTTASHVAYEGCIFSDCTIVPTKHQYGMQLYINEGATPSTAGLKLLRCSIQGSIYIRPSNNTSAHKNLKWLIDGCKIFAAANRAAIYIDMQATGNSFSCGGVTIANNTLHGADSNIIYGLYCKNTTNPYLIYGNLLLNCSVAAISFVLGTNGCALVDSNICTGGADIGSGSNATIGINNLSNIPNLLGALHDQDLLKTFGFSPFLPFEPIKSGGYTDPAIDFGQTSKVQTSLDHYGNPRQMGRASVNGYIYYFDASDDAVTDPNNAWTSETNIFDSSLTSNATCGTSGSASSNYTFAGGTNAPSSGGTIVKVQTRIRYAGSNGSSRTVGWAVYTDGLGESLGSFTQAMSSNTTLWSAWSDLSTPSGGWTWAKIQALETKVWEVSGSFNIQIYMVQIGVITDESTPDVGAVEHRGLMQQESTTVYVGDYSARLEGAGVWETLVPVSAEATAITVYARYDSNYTGNKPKIEVLNIPGVADQSDTMTSSANTWEQLSCSFTPTADGTVRLRLISQDTSLTGKTFFDDMRSEG